MKISRKMSLISVVVNLVKRVEHAEASVHMCVDTFMTVFTQCCVRVVSLSLDLNLKQCSRQISSLLTFLNNKNSA